MGELCLSPIGLSMVTKLAPLRMASLMMGAWFLFSAIANKVAGVVGSLINSGDQDPLANAMAIFSGLTITSVASGILLYFLANKLVDWMHGAEDNHKPDVNQQQSLNQQQATQEEMNITAEPETVAKH